MKRIFEPSRPTAPRPVLWPILWVALAAVLLLGCGTQRIEVDENSSAEELYRSARNSLATGDFLTAIDTFETLGARYPFGNYTQQAQLDITYAYFRQDEFDSAIAAADRFIKLYPQSEHVDYAYYMKGVSNYSRGGSFTERLFPRDMAKVNQNWLRAAFADFDQLVRRYPDSQYTPDARERMEYLRDEMARHELLVAQFYYERGAMIAAINRTTQLLEQFDGSKHVPNALALMAAAQKSLGQTDLQQATLRVLAETEPDHPALESLEADAGA